MDLKNGSLIENKFEILERIGAGGMGTVYKAKDLTLLRTFVLKILSPSYNSSKAFVRFQNEAKVLGKLQHPGIADIYDVGVTSEGLAYLALEFVDGIALDSFIESGEQIPLSQFIQIFIEIADALSHAHSVGIIHRDIKPANIMLVKTDDGFFAPVLLDFGIAKFDTADDAEQRLTEAGAMIGSPLYMSPEQCKGETVTAASDQYSLGCVLFECLSGEPPFRGDTAYDTALLHISQDCPDPVSVSTIPIPAELGGVIQKMLEKNPSERFKDIDELVKSLIEIRELALEQENSVPAQDSDQETVIAQNIRKKSVSPKWLFLCLGLTVLGGVASFETVRRWLIPERSSVASSSDSVENLEDIVLPEDTRITLKFSLMSQNILNQLSKRNNLTRVDLTDSATTDDMLKALAPSKDTLHELILRGTSVKSLSNLPALKNIQWLILSNTDVDDKALSNTVQLKRLNILEVESCPKLTKAALKTFEKYPLVRLIQLKGTSIQKEDIVKLQERMPRTVFDPFLRKAPVEEMRKNAVAQFKQGNFAESLTIYDKAIDALCTARGKNCAQATDLLLEAAAAAAALKRPSLTKAYLDRADTCAKEFRAPWLQITVLGAKITFTASFEPNIAKQLELLKEQRKLIEEIRQENSQLGRDNMFSIGMVLTHLKKFDDAGNMLKKCMEFDLAESKNQSTSESLRSAAYQNYGNDLNGLGRIAVATGEYAKGERYLRRALKIGSKNNKPKVFAPLYSDLHSALAGAINAQGRHREALKYMEEALAISRANGLVVQTKLYERALEDIRKQVEHLQNADANKEAR